MELILLFTVFLSIIKEYKFSDKRVVVGSIKDKFRCHSKVFLSDITNSIVVFIAWLTCHFPKSKEFF